MLMLDQDKQVFREAFELYERHKDVSASADYWDKVAADVQTVRQKLTGDEAAFFTDMVIAIYAELQRNYNAVYDGEQMRL